MQVGPYSIEHQNKNYGGLHMHMVHHCILSTYNNVDAKWDESRFEPQNQGFHSNLLSTYLLKSNWENDYVLKPLNHNQGIAITCFWKKKLNCTQK
jgi:hypothetical protein